MKRFTIYVPRVRDSCTSYTTETIDYLTSIAPSLLDIYKEEINIFSNKLANTLSQNSKYDYTIDLEEGKTPPQMPLYNLL